MIENRRGMRPIHPRGKMTVDRAKLGNPRRQPFIKPDPALHAANNAIAESVPKLNRLAARQYAEGGKVGKLKELFSPNQRIRDKKGFEYTVRFDMPERKEVSLLDENEDHMVLKHNQIDKKFISKPIRKAEGGKVGALRSLANTAAKLMKQQLHFEDIASEKEIPMRLAEVAKGNGVSTSDFKVVKVSKGPNGGFIVTIRGPSGVIQKIRNEGVSDDMSDGELDSLVRADAELN